jgi:hypothetical protein
LTATKDIEIDQCKIEIIRLKSKLRQVSSDKSIADIYDNFEEDLKRFTKIIIYDLHDLINIYFDQIFSSHPNHPPKIQD